MTISWARAVSRINSRQRSPTSPPRTATRYLVVQTPSYLQSQTVWLPRLYPSILPVYAAKCRRPKPPKGVGFTDPLSGTVNTPPAKAGGFRLRLEAGLVRPLADSDGGCASSYLEIIVRLWRCLVLDIFGPYLIGNVSAAGDPISSAP